MTIETTVLHKPRHIPAGDGNRTHDQSTSSAERYHSANSPSSSSMHCKVMIISWFKVADFIQPLVCLCAPRLLLFLMLVANVDTWKHHQSQSLWRPCNISPGSVPTYMPYLQVSISMGTFSKMTQVLLVASFIYICFWKSKWCSLNIDFVDFILFSQHFK